MMPSESPQDLRVPIGGSLVGKVSDALPLHSQPFTIICVCGSQRYAPPPYRMSTEGKGFWGRIHAHFFNWISKNAD